MKKRYIVVGLLAAFLSAKAQQTEAPYTKQSLRSKDVSLLMSFYTQDNDHSAVTGGIGTEDLQVYATSLSMAWIQDSVHTITLDGGADIISSASTDNINFVFSSASREDVRSHVNLSYDRVLKNNFSAGVNGAFSIESDYTSFGLGANVAHVSADQSRSLGASIQGFADDLRWGRLDNGRAQKLLYPSELRYKEWFDEHNRYSVNAEIYFHQTISKRTTLGFYPGFVFQQGLLSTPFHRVYFEDNALRVEVLPDTRIKIPIGVELNTFLGFKTILKASYRFYWDDFGISAHTLSVDAPYKMSRVWTLLPSVRFYTQSASDYFKPYKAHAPAEDFYTSDYDLSQFESVKVGMGFRYAPFIVKKRRTFEEIEFRYSVYGRSDGLVAHMMSLFLSYAKQRK
ncbi:DUF3570 domain-containing protein [Pseudochryseolinea flava]|uniref:DUF3570 domain-containing protein n=1 Tax=Pseudochryseolinea flava TaxID=2059302 RepID=A0A364Y6N7_9BACT|nr:DUF3570 domain-containing protein [Pseudochryseolinea flava]RAW02637.1 hypothetical protein DQQ10_00565 [Pseudochryseolinea flava]